MSSAPATDRRSRLRVMRRAVALILCTVAAGCAASSGAVHRAVAAERRQDYDVAVVEYTKAVRLNPDDQNARTGLERAKLRASQDHFTKGRRLAAVGKLDLALAELEVAAELNPTNGELDDELRATRNKRSEEHTSELQSLR